MQADFVVIGGGVVGACTAYHLARAGKDVILLERGSELAPQNPTSSSGDATKCFRSMYGSDRNMTRMSKASFSWWEKFQEESGQRLFLPCGMAALGAIEKSTLQYWDDHQIARSALDSVPVLEAEGIPFDFLSRAELVERYPQISLSPLFDHALLDRSAGIIYADKAVRAIGELARKAGAEILFDIEVKALVRKGEKVVAVETTQGEVAVGKSLVLAAGAMNTVLAPELAAKTRVTRQQVLYLRPDNLTSYTYDELPIVIDLNSWRYVLPGVDGVVKIADDANHLSQKKVDPSAGFAASGDAWFEVDARNFLKEFVPGLSDAPRQESHSCLYTNTANEAYLIYRRENCVVVSACSGHGFKNGPMSAFIASELACGTCPERQANMFRYENAQNFT